MARDLKIQIKSSKIKEDRFFARFSKKAQIAMKTTENIEKSFPMWSKEK